MNEFRKDLENLTAGIDDGREIALLLDRLKSEVLGLAGLELRLFGHTLTAIVVLSVMAFVMLMVGWLLVGVSLVLALSNLQPFSLMSALLTVTVLHLSLAGLMLWYLEYLTRDLTFRETRSGIVSLVTRIKRPASAAPQGSRESACQADS